MDEKYLIDTTTRFFRRAIDVLLLTHPQRTALGTIFGLSIDVMIRLFSPYLKTLSWIDVTAVEQWQYIILGILFLHIPTIIILFQQRPELPEEIETIFSAIKKAQTEGVPKHQLNPLYRKLCEKVLMNLSSNQILDSKEDHISKRFKV